MASVYDLYNGARFNKDQDWGFYDQFAGMDAQQAAQSGYLDPVYLPGQGGDSGQDQRQLVEYGSRDMFGDGTEGRIFNAQTGTLQDMGLQDSTNSWGDFAKWAALSAGAGAGMYALGGAGAGAAAGSGVPSVGAGTAGWGLSGEAIGATAGGGQGLGLGAAAGGGGLSRLLGGGSGMAGSLASLIGPGIGTIASLYGARESASAARDAAKMQADAAREAAAMQREAAMAGIGEVRRQYDTTRGDQIPWLQAGQRQLGNLEAKLPELTKAFTGQDLQNDPGYQFALNQGLNGISAKAKALGISNSGGTLKELMKYGQDYAGTKFGEAFSRDQAQKQSVYNMLAGISGTGQVASGEMGKQGAGAANSIAGLMGQGANAGAAGLTGAANAGAAGIVGGANAWTNAATNVGRMWSDWGYSNMFGR